MSHIRRVHTQSQGRFGSPQIADALREQGVKASRNRIARLMRRTGIRSIVYKKYRVQTTDSNHDYPVAKKLLNREFTADKPEKNRSAEAMGVRHHLYCHSRRLAVPDSNFGFSGSKSG